jgi:DNA repair protein RadC
LLTATGIELNSERINKWPSHDRPREKLVTIGAEQLTDSELLAVILRIGIGSSSKAGVGAQSAVDLARSLLSDFEGLSGLDRADIKDLLKVRGLSTAKASQIKAAFELGKRIRSHSSRLRTFERSNDVASYLTPRLMNKRDEVVVALFLDGQNHLLSDKVVSIGIPIQAAAPIRKVLEEALRASATSIVLAHNHPSGNAEPSLDDDQTTCELDQGATLLGLVLLDHVILGSEIHYSYADSGRLDELRVQQGHQ